MRECGDALICEDGWCRECENDKECIDLNGAEQACIPFNRRLSHPPCMNGA